MRFLVGFALSIYGVVFTGQVILMLFTREIANQRAAAIILMVSVGLLVAGLLLAAFDNFDNKD